MPLPEILEENASLICLLIFYVAILGRVLEMLKNRETRRIRNQMRRQYNEQGDLIELIVPHDIQVLVLTTEK